MKSEEKVEIYKDSLDLIIRELTDYIAVLRLIAVPTRSDGTYNRCRGACEKLAREVLYKYDDKNQL